MMMVQDTPMKQLVHVVENIHPVGQHHSHKAIDTQEKVALARRMSAAGAGPEVPAS